MKYKQVKINAFSYAQLVKLMMEGIYNCEELAEMTGLHYMTVLHYSRELYAAKVAHISSWDKDRMGRDSKRVYKLGPGKDMPRQKITDAERQARYRSKKRAMQDSRIMTALASPLHA